MHYFLISTFLILIDLPGKTINNDHTDTDLEHLTTEAVVYRENNEKRGFPIPKKEDQRLFHLLVVIEKEHNINCNSAYILVRDGHVIFYR